MKKTKKSISQQEDRTSNRTENTFPRADMQTVKKDITNNSHC